MLQMTVLVTGVGGSLAGQWLIQSCGLRQSSAGPPMQLQGRRGPSVSMPLLPRHCDFGRALFDTSLC